MLFTPSCVCVLYRFNVLPNIDFKILYYLKALRQHGQQIKSHDIVIMKRRWPRGPFTLPACACVCVVVLFFPFGS